MYRIKSFICECLLKVRPSHLMLQILMSIAHRSMSSWCPVKASGSSLTGRPTVPNTDTLTVALSQPLAASVNTSGALLPH